MTPHFPIYMDYGATTPVDQRVVDAMIPVVARALRQPGVAQPCLGLGSGGGGREGARAGRRPDRRRPARDHLDVGCDRVGQPRPERRGAVLQDPRQAPRHREDRAQGSARHDARARAPGIRGDLPRRQGRRPARPRCAQGGAPPRHDPGLGDVRQQRDRRDPGHRRRSARSAASRASSSTSTRRRPRARSRSTWPSCRST